MTPELVGEPVVVLQLAEDAGALVSATVQNASNGELRVVVQDAPGHPTEEGKRRAVPVTEGLRRLRRICLDVTVIAVRQVDGQEVRLPLDPGDLHKGFAEALS